jgi:HK97 family phage major capsid protein
MPASTASAPELTQEQVQRILIQPLQAAPVFMASGPRVFDTDGSPVRVPKLNSMDAPSWIGENTLIPDVEADFGEVTLLPTTMKSLKSLTKFSNELARQSVVALDSALQDKMVRDIASKLDAQFFAGTGASNTPTGMVSWSGTQQITTVGAIGLDDLLDAIALCMAANVDQSRLRWFMRSGTYIALRKLEDGADRKQLNPDPTQGANFSLFGIPVSITNALPVNTTPTPDTTVVALTDMSTVAVARDQSPTAKILTERFAEFDQTAIRVTARYDVAPLLPEATVLLRDVNL